MPDTVTTIDPVDMRGLLQDRDWEILVLRAQVRTQASQIVALEAELADLREQADQPEKENASGPA